MNYAAAGILPLARHQDRVFVLLGSEPSKKSKGPEMFWLAFGGKREPEDLHAKATALREYREESGGLLPDPTLLSQVFYDNRARFVLHIGWLPYQVDLPSFSNQQAADQPTLNKRQLQWFPLEDVLIGDQFGLQGQTPVKPWFLGFLQRERFAIRALLKQSV